jgi:hypothetical protein
MGSCIRAIVTAWSIQWNGTSFALSYFRLHPYTTSSPLQQRRQASNHLCVVRRKFLVKKTLLFGFVVLGSMAFAAGNTVRVNLDRD